MTDCEGFYRNICNLDYYPNDLICILCCGMKNDKLQRVDFNGK